MRIFEKLNQESAEFIEDSIIKSCEGLRKDLLKIYHLCENQPFAAIIDKSILSEFLDHYEREIPLLESIGILLESTKINTCVVEKLILSQMYDYLKDRIDDIKFLRNMFDKEVSCCDVQNAIGDFFDSPYLRILRD